MFERSTPKGDKTLVAIAERRPLGANLHVYVLKERRLTGIMLNLLSRRVHRCGHTQDDS
jgi:hypothetical protein